MKNPLEKKLMDDHGLMKELIQENFEVTFDQNDGVAYDAFNEIQIDTNEVLFKSEILTHSLGGVPVPILTITAAKDIGLSMKK